MWSELKLETPIARGCLVAGVGRKPLPCLVLGTHHEADGAQVKDALRTVAVAAQVVAF
jgi:hypothetical protein